MFPTLRRKIALTICPELSAPLQHDILAGEGLLVSGAAEKLLILSRAYGTHANISHWAVSMRIFRKGDFFRRLEKGTSPQSDTVDRVLAWFDTNWPADLDWPAHIERPSARRRVS